MKAPPEVIDDFGDSAAACILQFRPFGRSAFSRGAATVRCFEDNLVLRKCLGERGDGWVLVIDGGGACHYALLGDYIAVRARPGTRGDRLRHRSRGGGRDADRPGGRITRKRRD